MTTETKTGPVKELPYEPTPTHYKTMEFIWGKGGFKDVLSKAPSFMQAISSLPSSFWEFGGQVDFEVAGGYDLSVSLELDGQEGRTVLDVELESTEEGLRDAFLTLIDPAPEEGTEAERSSFQYFGMGFTEPISDTATAEAKINELKERLESLFIPPAPKETDSTTSSN